MWQGELRSEGVGVLHDWRGADARDFLHGAVAALARVLVDNRSGLVGTYTACTVVVRLGEEDGEEVVATLAAFDLARRRPLDWYAEQLDQVIGSVWAILKPETLEVANG